jgi:hypothetical protein
MSQLKRIVKDENARAGLMKGLKKYINSKKFKGTVEPMNLYAKLKEVKAKL